MYIYSVHLYVNLNRQNNINETYFVVSFGFVTWHVGCLIEWYIFIIENIYLNGKRKHRYQRLYAPTGNRDIVINTAPIHIKFNLSIHAHDK